MDAARRGDAVSAQNNLGLMYQNGEGVEQKEFDDDIPHFT